MRGDNRRRILAVLMAAILAFGVSAEAQEDDGSITAAYRLFEEAIAAGDFDEAVIHAQLVYERALEKWGKDNIQTGYIAANYAELLVVQEYFDKAIEVYGVCAEVLADHLPEAAIDLANCQGALGNLHWQADDAAKAREAFLAVTELVDYAQEDERMRSRAAEAYLLLAADAVPATIRLQEPDRDESHRFERAKDYVLTGLPYILDSYGEESDEVALAYQLLATFYEFARDWQASEVYYRRAHTIYYDKYGSEDERTRTAYGRVKFANLQDPDVEWTAVKGDEARDEISRARDMRPELKKGCFETMVDGSWVSTCEVKRPMPRYPSVAGRKGQFGFIEARFDILTDGTVDNVSIYTGWPKEVWDESLIKAVSRWEFTPPKAEDGSPSTIPGRRTWFTFRLVH